MRDLIEKARYDKDSLEKLLEMLEKGVPEEAIRELLDLANRLRDRDEEAYERLKKILTRYVSEEEYEACMEENIEEYES